MDSAFATLLRARLERREEAAATDWRGALLELNLPDEQVGEVLQRIGRSLTWSIWEIAIEEAAFLHQLGSQLPGV